MKKMIFSLYGVIKCFICIFIVLVFQQSNAQTFCIDSGSDQITGVEDGYRYELWNQNSQGTACMTLGDGALFSGEWSNILNYLARRGLGYNQTQEHQEIGVFSATYNCNYNPSSASGNSYLSVYGWTVEPLIEYYIVEDWRNWIPSMAQGATLIDEFTVDGSVYEIYENTRTNQPSIVGTATFQQYFSIRKNERNSGSIDITAHFDKWESLGLELGKLHEVSLVVEGYQSNGSFEFTELAVIADNSTSTLTENYKDYYSIYPNPSSGNSFIQLNKSDLHANVKIYDSLGKIVFFQRETQNNTIEVSNLKSGIYFVEVEINNIHFTTKLVVY